MKKSILHRVERHGGEIVIVVRLLGFVVLDKDRKQPVSH